MTDSKLIDRVRKLYAMAQDVGSPHEAAIAAKRARSLMDKNGITLADLETSQFGDSVSGNTWKKMPIYVQGIALTVAELNDCKVERTMGKVVFKGFEDDAITAQLMFEYLLQTMESCCNTHMKETASKGMKAKNDYRIGFKNGISYASKAIISERKADLKTATGSSLVVAKMAMVNREFGTTRISRRNIRYNEASSAAQAGYEQGKRTSMSNQVSGKAPAQITG